MKTERISVGGRLCSPGFLYNVGNVTAFAAGLVVAAAYRPASSGTGFWSAGADYVMGSRSAVLMTIATAVFFASGALYSRAFGREPESSLASRETRLADLCSGLGAVLLAAALACVGNTTLAIVLGALNAGGKLGSACCGRPAVTTPWKRRLIDAFRIAPLLSRLPAALAAFAGLLGAGRSAQDVVLSIVMLGCYAVWAIADALLMAGDHAPPRPLRGTDDSVSLQPLKASHA